MKNSHKNILITGAGKGIGESTAKLFLSKGYYVYALIKNKEDNIKFKNYQNILIINGNVNNTKLIEKIFSNSNKKNKIITGLINNAGIRHRKKFLEIKNFELKNVFDSNFFSIFKTMQLFSKKFD